MAPRRRKPPVDYKPAPFRKEKTVGWTWIVIGSLLGLLGVWGYHIWDVPAPHKGKTLPPVAAFSPESSQPLVLPSILVAAERQTPSPTQETAKSPVLQENPAPPREPEKVSEPAQQAPAQQTAETSVHPAEGPGTTSFDFYKILPDLKVGENTEEVTPAKPTPVKPPISPVKTSGTKPNQATTPSTKVYVLQAGAFHNPQEADRMRTRLSFLGLEANIQKITTPSAEVWHRVRIGPYRDFTEATQVQQRLRHDGVTATVNQELRQQ
ncbi:hypothetical protein CCP3SC1AL1_1000003 [Gammaproteobacteria bacterium]